MGCPQNRGIFTAYGFDEGSGSTLHDATGNGHDGTLTTEAWVTGKYGSALSFSGSFVTIADSSLLDLTTALTVSAWVKPLASHSNWPTIALKENSTGLSYALYAGWNEGTVAPSLCVGTHTSTDECAFGGVTPADEWTHLAGTFDGTSYRLYVNGELAGTTAETMPAGISDEPLRIGGNSIWNESFTGVIDELRIYARPLSSTEIQADMGTPMDCGANIDDGNPCTVDACNSTTGITHTPVPAGTSCDTDATVCNGTHTCDANAVCQPGTPPTLDDANPCTTDTCNPTTGVSHTPVAAGTSCANATVCDGAEVCDASGTCTAGTPPTTDDGNPCTLDTCDPVQGVLHTPAPTGTPCSDGNACTGADTCQGGVCTAGAPTTCVAIDQCHVAGTCDPASGACSNPTKPDGSACSDSDACTQADSCQAGTCVGANPVVCVASDACHVAGTCDSTTGSCTNPTAPNGTPCNDATVCNGTETCTAGTCTAGTPPAIDDGNPCTADACDPVTGVTHTPVLAGTSCANETLCDGAETCDTSGTCTAGTPPAIDDGNPCTIDSCDPTQGVIHTAAPAGTSCSDFNACNGAETCNATGACVAGTPPVISDDNPCTEDTCDPTEGVVHTPLPSGTSCSDFDLCNGSESCDAAGTCQPGTPVLIDTSNPCSTGTCNPATGIVTYAPSPPGTECFLDACTLAECNATGECTAAGSIVQDDGDPCTVEWCDPATGPRVATCQALDPTVGTTLHESMKWLFTGENPLQVGVAPGAIIVKRASALRGLVHTRDGGPLPSVRVSIVGHPEFGHTFTQSNGYFDMVVNGGGTLVVSFERDGYLSAQRNIKTGWGDYARVDDLVMIPPDPVVTAIDLLETSAPFQVARGSIQNDDDGSRQGTLLVPAGTSATMELADGTPVELDTMNVRITEFTVGEAGPASMPGVLPPESKYTYAFEVNSDEAVQAGAAQTTFSTPLTYYVENFLNFPAGTIVPVGSFDREASAWKPEPNGVVLDIIAESGGAAEVDVTGDGVVDTGSILSALGITNAELQQLATLYEPQQSLWRVPIAHFTMPWDCNWGGGPPDDAVSGGSAEAGDPPPPCPNGGSSGSEISGASTIVCDSQVLREEIPIAGTPYKLVYSSERTAGYTGKNRINITLSGPFLPLSLDGIILTVDVAGQRFQSAFDEVPNQKFAYDWNGLDAFGRPVQGAQTAHVSIDYTYEYVYRYTSRFGYNGGGSISGDPARSQIKLRRTIPVPVSNFEARPLGFGGWTLDAHHVHDLALQHLQLGSGQQTDGRTFAPMSTLVAFRTGENGTTREIAVAPDGAAYFTSGAEVLRATTADAAIRVAGGGPLGHAGDGLPATDPGVRISAGELAVGRDGSLYLAESGFHAVRRVGPDGIISTIAGTTVAGHSGDGGPATQARLEAPDALAVAPDNTLYIGERWSIRRVAPDGSISTFAGTGDGDDPDSLPPDGTLATTVTIRPGALALAPDGTLYAALKTAGHTIANRIVRFMDGRVYHVAGNGNVSFQPDGQPGKESSVRTESIAIDAAGRMIWAELSNRNSTGGQRESIRSISLSDGNVYTLAGVGDGGPEPGVGATCPTQASPQALLLGTPYRVRDVAFGPDGIYAGADCGSAIVLRSVPPQPRATGASFTIAAHDQPAVFTFDALVCRI